MAAVATMVIFIAAGAGAAPAAAANERMQLWCISGSLTSHFIERTNGSSWWNVTNGDVYTTKSIVVSSEEEGTVYAKDYGNKSGGGPETCTGDRFDFTWDVELVRVAK